MRVAVRADHSVPHACRSHLSAPVVEAQLGLVAPSTKIYTLPKHERAYARATTTDTFSDPTGSYHVSNNDGCVATDAARWFSLA